MTILHTCILVLHQLLLFFCVISFQSFVFCKLDGASSSVSLVEWQRNILALCIWHVLRSLQDHGQTAELPQLVKA